MSSKLGTSNPLNSFGDTAGLSLTLTATCQGCYITGNAVVTTTGVKKDESILGDIISFLKDPTEVVINALDLNLEVSLENFGGHFELDITFAAAGTYTVMLYKSESPVGVEVRLPLPLVFSAWFSVAPWRADWPWVVWYANCSPKLAR